MSDGILDRFGLDGGVAVVTGAGRGIGEGIAIGLAEAGCDVVLTARRENEINAVADRVRALGRRAIAIPGDITDEQRVLLHQLANSFGTPIEDEKGILGKIKDALP